MCITMFLRTYTPGPPLDAYIDRFWYCSDTPSHPRERILPSGTVELVINLTGDEIRIYDPSHPNRAQRYSGAVVSGPYSNFFLIDPLVHGSIIGVHFRPGRAVPVLGVPANELADAHVDLESVWGRTTAELRERLCSAAAPEKRFAVLEEVLLRRLRQSPPRSGAIPVVLDAFEQADAAVKVRRRGWAWFYGTAFPVVLAALTAVGFVGIGHFYSAFALAILATPWIVVTALAIHLYRGQAKRRNDTPAGLGTRSKTVVGLAPHS
jgi:hypothetical protein